ncbi:MAG: hypothetical protein IH856_11395 [Deltaproteobacteria bacterium]|nr:hypothetical protein [Deltaproteobacteria bacterium]
MRQNPYPVIDGDGHVVERTGELLEFLGGNTLGPARTKTGRILFPSFLL